MWNLHESTFIILFHHSVGKWFGTFFPCRSLKSQGCLLTNWLPITSILFKILRICRSLFKCNYLKNENRFLTFLFHQWNLHHISKIFTKRKIVIANVFLKLQNVKDLVRQLYKKRRFRTSFNSQHVKGSETLQKSSSGHFYQIFSALLEEIIWKMAPLFKFEIIVVFVNTLTADCIYPLSDCEDLSFPIQMQLS